MTTTRDPDAEREWYERVYASEDFQGLRRRFRAFVFPVTVGFLAWYMLYVLAAIYAPGVMAAKVVGNVNVALVFGLLQFASTFGIAWWYARKAGRDFDPVASRISGDFDLSDSGAAAPREEAR
ncbi:MAG: DUF485 domain-containing protein [Carbonactinosporaceae bacterium]